MRKFLLTIIVMVAAVSAAERIPIETLGKFNQALSAFEITESFEVKEGNILVIPAGTKILFGPLVGITVKGEIFVDGTPDRMVTLMSRRAALEAGSAHDWGGIRLFPGAVAQINYAVISNASFGIRTCCDNVTLLNSIFHTNGVHFQIGERRVFVTERMPMTFEPVPTTTNRRGDVRQVGVAYDDLVTKRMYPVRSFVVGGVSVAALAVGVVYLTKWGKAIGDYNDYIPYNMSYDEREAEFNRLRKKANTNAWIGWSSTVVGVGLGTYTVIYTINF